MVGAFNNLTPYLIIKSGPQGLCTFCAAQCARSVLRRGHSCVCHIYTYIHIIHRAHIRLVKLFILGLIQPIQDMISKD